MPYEKKDGRKLVTEAIKRFTLVSEIEAEQRKRETDDLRFQVPEFQWTEDAKQAREGSRGGGAGVPAVPARPMLSISQLNQPMQLVRNQMRAAHLGINIHPSSEDADDETATVIKGLYYRIQQDPLTESARDWAFGRAFMAGRGYYRINTEWDRETRDPSDQKIVIRRILHQSSVYFDPSAQEADFSDARWAFIVSWIPLDQFKRRYPKAKASSAEDGTFAAWVKDYPDWVKQDGETYAILVAEYYCKHFEAKTLKGTSGFTREDEDWSLWWYALAGCEDTPLGEQECNGKHIPIVPVIGEELQPFDSKRWYQGMIGPNKDGQRFYNYAASNLAETMALEPKAPYMATLEQIQGFETWYQQANIRNFPYLPYNAVAGPGGSPLPPPMRVQADNTKMSISMMALQEAKNFIQSGTGVFDPALGNLSQKERSGKAIVALQSQADASTSVYMANFAKISLPCEARIILDLIPAVYDRRGRIVRTMDFEGNEKPVMVNAPYVMDGKRPRMLVDEQIPREAKQHNLRSGVYGVTVTVGKSHQTLAQEGSDEIGRILEADPTLMPLLGATYFKFRDFQGAKEIAQILKKVRDKQFPGLDQEEGAQATPDQLMAQLEAAKGENQQLKQMLATATQAIETDQVKGKTQMEKAQIDAAKSVKVAQIGADAKLAEQRMESALALILKRMETQDKRAEARDEIMLKMLELQTQAQQGREQRDHEVGMGRADAGMRALEGVATRGQESEESERSREFESEQADRGRAFEGEQAEAERQAAREQAEREAEQPDGGDV
jgi:hypothetical protein